MTQRSFGNWSWTPTAVAAANTMTANGACFIQGGSATQLLKVSAITLSGLAAATAACQMQFSRDSTVAVTAITLGTNGSDAPLDVFAAALAAPPVTGFSATTMPQKSASLQLLTPGFNAFGGQFIFQAYPGKEITIYGVAVNVGECSLSANTGGTPGLMESTIIYEPSQPLRCAVCDLTTGEVNNVIVADPNDPAPDGSQLVAVGDAGVDAGWVLSSDGSFTQTISADDIATAVASYAGA